MSTLNEEARDLKSLRKQRDVAKAVFDDLDDEYKVAQSKLFARMEADDCAGTKTDGTSFVPTSTVYGSIQDRAAFVEWAADEAPELLEVRERKNLLNEVVREYIDDGRPLPPGLGFYAREYISQRVASK